MLSFYTEGMSINILVVVEDYGLETVQEYMYHIRNNAENSVRSLLREVARKLGTNVLSAVDYLDDGSPARLSFYIWWQKSDSLNENGRSVFESR